jgi:NADPH:quinone reductase-like Zn-dependent oxidoreductase
MYRKLGDLVAAGSLSAAVEEIYPLDRFQDAFQHALKPRRAGKILFTFGGDS